MSHPARYSPEVLDVIGPILTAEWPEWFGRPIVHDSFAGTGVRLVEFGREYGFRVSGTEIEACFVQCPTTVMVGDSRDPATYPPLRYPNEVATAGWVQMTSPTYANGMADGHLPRDGSRRKTYRKAKIDLTGNPEAKLEPGSMAGLGYRGTKRDGKSQRRARYWEIADACVANWGSASLVIVNVSDFVSGGEVEPHVADWKALLARHGWVDQTDHEVATPRMRDGANGDVRVDHEVVIVARKP